MWTVTLACGGEAPIVSSQPTTRHRFVLTNHNDAIRLHSGTVIDGTADTTHPVWTMSNVNVESDKPMRGD